MKCLDEHAALDFVEGRLTPDAAAQVERHVDACGTCFALRAGLARLGSLRTDDRTSSDAPAGDEAPAKLLARGATIGRYVVLDIVGRGAMGTVYAAYDPELSRKVALKVVRADVDGDREATARHLR